MSGGPRLPCQLQRLLAPVPVLSELFHLPLLQEPRPQPEIALAAQPLDQEGSRGLQAPEEPGDALSSKASWSEFGLSERRLVLRGERPSREREFGSATVGTRR